MNMRFVAGAALAAVFGMGAVATVVMNRPERPTRVEVQVPARPGPPSREVPPPPAPPIVSASPAAFAPSRSPPSPFQERRSPPNEGGPLSPANLRALMGPVRTVPVLHGGKMEGFRVSGVRPGSLLTLIGLRNGDVIESIDGKALSPENALVVYGAITSRSAERLSLGVLREGVHMVILYRII